MQWFTHENSVGLSVGLSTTTMYKLQVVVLPWQANDCSSGQHGAPSRHTTKTTCYEHSNAFRMRKILQSGEGHL